MAFGIPGSDSGAANGEFLSRIQYDARVGFWKNVSRVQTAEGWSNVESAPYQNPSFLVDFGTFEVGYINLTTPPQFLVVPFGKPIPPQPTDMQLDAQGKQRKAFQPGFRLKLSSAKTFGDSEPRYFSNSSKTVMGPMEELWMRYLDAEEAKKGKIPAVKVNRTSVIEIKGPKGINKFYAPVFEIVGWFDRPENLGPRTVPVPTASGIPPATTTAPVAAPAEARPSAPPANHVPPPTAKVQEPGAAPGAVMAMADEDLPF